VSSLAAALDATRYQSYVYAYPHKTAYRPLDPPRPLGPVWAGERRDALFLYVHIPFCEQRCGFCNLFTRPVPEARQVDAYLATLTRQAHVVRRALDEGGAFAIARAAIGGGTPTLLDTRQLERVIAVMRDVGLGAPGRGVAMSVETSPETALPDRLAVVVGSGADRISIGVQSFVDAECKAVNRPQRATDVHRALRAIRDAGPATLNIDLMYGLPGQTAASWQASLAAALDYRPEELYLYPLYVRPLTTLGKRSAEAGDPTGSLHPAGAAFAGTSRDLASLIDAGRVALYDHGREVLLAAGYRQVSLRMFRRDDADTSAGPVYCCQDDGMIGLGCGARSYTRELHYSTEWAVGARGVRGILDRWIQRDDAAFAVADYGFSLDAGEQRRRWVILSLLSEHGLDVAAYRARFGADPVAEFPELAELVPRGLASHDGDALRLTPEGLGRADALGPWLYSADVKRRMADYELT
jgi:oxygen-independent coproporphyrinogen-3 oxidase